MKRIELEETAQQQQQGSKVNKLDKVKQLSEQEILAKKQNAISQIQAEFICESVSF